MTGKQLRNTILQEAIEGRLVPQDPNDQPASVLLERIRDEKRRLVKEGKLKKKDLEENPISEDEIPFDIPDSWAWVRLGSVISLLSGRDLAPGDYNDTEIGIPYITGASNFDDGALIINRWTPKPVVISKCGDLLITCKGTIGTMAFNEIGEIHIARQVMALSSYLIDIRYIQFFLTRIVYELDKKAKSIIPGISREDILTALFPLPPLAEQKRIVAKIEELLPKVEEYGKAQDALDKLNAELPERLKKSILQEAISGRLVPQDPNDEPASILLDKIRAEKAKLVKEGKLKKKDLEETPIQEDEIPFDIPDSWEWVRVSDVVNVLMGQSPDGNDVFEAKEDNEAYEFHQGKICFTEKYIIPSGKWCKTPSRIANKDSLLICVRAPIGDVNITQRSIGIGRGLAAMEGMGNISNMFLFYWMLAHKRCLEDQGTGSTFKAITVEVLKNQKIPLPPLAEQKRIVAKIEQLLGEIDNLKA